MVSELLTQNPRESIIVFALIVTFFMSLVTKYTTDQTRIRTLKQEQKTLSQTVRTEKDNLEKQKELNQKMFLGTMELFKHSFKPVLITMIPLLIFFFWLKEVYAPIFPHWLWWYIGSSIFGNILFRKVLNVA